MSRAQREAVIQRQRQALARGSLTPAERIRFDEDRAWAMYAAEKRRQARAAHKLPEAA